MVHGMMPAETVPRYDGDAKACWTAEVGVEQFPAISELLYIFREYVGFGVF